MSSKPVLAQAFKSPYESALPDEMEAPEKTDMHWTVAKLVHAASGLLLQGDEASPVRAICTDTRHICEGDCFVALQGEYHDGHDFIDAALQRGAGAVVISKNRTTRDIAANACVPIIEVPDTLYALGEFARHLRNHFSIPVVGIGGSNGKTSTKEMVAGILSHNKLVLKNQGNFNNLIGVPLTLLGLNRNHQAAVIEMGINVPGEMERLAQIVTPTVAVLTNIHPAHLEGLHSLDQILAEKSRLFTNLSPRNTAVINLDDHRLAQFSSRLNTRTVTYSIDNPSAHISISGEIHTAEGKSLFSLCFDGTCIPVQLPVLGIHQVQNALAAAAVTWAMGEAPSTIAECLSRHQPVRQRMQMHRLLDGGILIDDTYNANPRSMTAAAQAAATAVKGRPLILILGEMRELGESAPALHREVGEHIAALNVQQLITCGELGREIASGAQRAGMRKQACYHAQNHDDAVAWVKQHRPEGAWVLVKGSRGMTMERVTEGILSFLA